MLLHGQGFSRVLFLAERGRPPIVEIAEDLVFNEQGVARGRCTCHLHSITIFLFQAGMHKVNISHSYLHRQCLKSSDIVFECDPDFSRICKYICNAGRL